MGTRLGIDFLWILMDFGRQVGPENPIRSGQIRSDQIRSGQVRSGQVRSGQIRSDQVWVGQVMSILARSDNKN